MQVCGSELAWYWRYSQQKVQSSVGCFWDWRGSGWNYPPKCSKHFKLIWSIKRLRKSWRMQVFFFCSRWLLHQQVPKKPRSNKLHTCRQSYRKAKMKVLLIWIWKVLAACFRLARRVKFWRSTSKKGCIERIPIIHSPTQTTSFFVVIVILCHEIYSHENHNQNHMFTLLK